MCSRLVKCVAALWSQQALFPSRGFPANLSCSSPLLLPPRRVKSSYCPALKQPPSPGETAGPPAGRPGVPPVAKSLLVTVPRYLERTAVRRQQRQERRESRQQQERHRAALRQGNRRVRLLTCSDARLHHHLHQTYNMLHGPTLCSQHWNRCDKAGQFFTVHRRPVNAIDEAYFDSGQSENPNSDTTFSYLPIDRTLVTNLTRMGIHTPTEIQTKALEAISGNSVSSGGCTMLVAQTGRGKTLAYLVPIVHQLLQNLERPYDAQVPLNEPLLIVVTPGRELACQIKDVCWKLVKDTGLSCSLLLGTHFRKRLLNPQVRRMDVLVASLGALNKMVAAKQIGLSRLKHVVLDEADTLLDDTFHEDTGELLSRLSINTGCAAGQDPAELERAAAAVSGTASSLVDLTLASATVPRELNELLSGVLMPGALKEVVTSDIHSLQTNVEHRFHRVASSKKSEIFIDLCRKIVENKESAIIFSNSGKCSKFVSRLLAENNLDCVYLSAELSADDRRGRWLHFLHSQPALLVCTDIVSRGLDSTGVHHVINYDSPWNVSDYIHRAGRVGRVGSSVPGTVTSLVHKRPEIWVAQLIEMSVRKGTMLKSVDANISKIISKRFSY